MLAKEVIYFNFTLADALSEMIKEVIYLMIKLPWGKFGKLSYNFVF